MSGANKGQIIEQCLNYKEAAEKIGWHSRGDIKMSAAGQTFISGKDGTKLMKNTAIPTPTEDFSIRISMDKTRKTFVPLGIADFDGNEENQYFIFDYTLTGVNIDTLFFEISDSEGNVLFSEGHLAPVIIRTYNKPIILLSNNKPYAQPYQKSFIELLTEYSINDEDYTQPGSYTIFWDGFNNEGIYDSTLLHNKTLIAKVKGEKEGKIKETQVKFSTQYKKVNWVDIKIDKNLKKIDATLRVNLRDGGEEGLNDYDQVSVEALKYYNLPPIQKRQWDYNMLSSKVVDGINKFWSRNSNNIGKKVTINNMDFEVSVNALIDENGQAAPIVIYQTNGEEGRSRNWELSRKLFFTEGYIYYDKWKDYPNSIIYNNKGWKYAYADWDDFSMTSAHEIGHEILLAYGGQNYSKSHKHTSTVITQEVLDSSGPIPTTGEVDLMKYYSNYYDIKRTVVSEPDLIQLLWLTKLKIN